MVLCVSLFLCFLLSLFVCSRSRELVYFNAFSKPVFPPLPGCHFALLNLDDGVRWLYLLIALLVLFCLFVYLCFAVNRLVASQSRSVALKASSLSLSLSLSRSLSVSFVFSF